MTAASTIVRDLKAEIESVTNTMATLNSPGLASERAGLVGRKADLQHQLEIAETRVQFEGRADDDIETSLLEAGSELETLPDQLAALENVPGAKYRRAALERLQAELEAQVHDLEIESTTRQEAARLERGLQSIASQAAEAARTKAKDHARQELAKLEADIRENGYRGHGPQIEAWRAEVAKYEALEGTPVSEAEIAQARTDFLARVEQRQADKMAAVEESAAALDLPRQRTTPRQLVV